ncbi:NAD(P)/FAD-dependent oxidoreductase [Flavobacteriaceae bacterium]|uniref:NAD(P)/FAD-dependent oxidoreductase n=1 Tax=Candidatus Arcticimaribacter forsetii TaxID=2820661 RepID=UPI0020779041|nr:FAD/NAD(P)-binding oxidoreductase [Candidatus Arcticimaribacter forsetii]MDA8698744.1 NAD(P)/FAD-dependent oxidoreductase [Flavobacteriaceae bacterium]MDB2325711.1 NAD(P)/FAD-dependent oxidoreductase [Flavobacteriaceae bacterium]MDB2329202.1 NAD(P)/FAD-dependent oxidoreductase [Flavobacteriaceae bacterium]MDB4620757.1 NAD(P)/FAD-dependent oxidoreductase [Flavobacteriaceae bacterium]MDB4674681.1 NAD(P)/FAD-dependent oxidoreductase [Flavobacteriaceae bacterium]
MNAPPIIIIGNGIAGITTARHIRKKSNKPILIISKESKYFFSRTALMYVYMGHLKWEHTQPYESHFWKKNKLNLLQETVTNIDSENKKITLSNESILSYDSLVLATGSIPNKFGWPGENHKGVQGLYSKQDLENLESLSASIQEAVIVGGGLIGIELAEMLHSRGKKVTFLVREKSFWNNVLPKQESKIINQHILSHGIDLRLDTNLEEIIADENGRVKLVRTDKGDLISCQFVGLTAGVKPNVEFIKQTNIATNRGILVNKYLETNQPGVYAIGDCAEQKEPQPGRRSIEAVWYTGRMMGETLAQTLTGTKTEYNPGNWFNSAKFFDIEYQTYGLVSAHPEDNEKHFHWKHSVKDHAITIAYNKETYEFLGINTFGIRMRHEIFDQILSDKRTVFQVAEHLKDCNFDPEFFNSYEEEIITKFNLEFKTKIKLKRKSWSRIFNSKLMKS